MKFFDPTTMLSEAQAGRETEKRRIRNPTMLPLHIPSLICLPRRVFIASRLLSMSLIMLNKRVYIGCGGGMQEFLWGPDLMDVAFFKDGDSVA